MTSSSSSSSSLQSLNFITFNQDHSCLAVGTTRGFRIYHTDPFSKIFSSNEGNISIIGMLFSTSLVALIMSPRHLMIQNTKRSSVICELTFPSAVLALRMNRRRLAVVLENEIYVYDIANMALLHTIATSPNPHAIVALSPSSEAPYLAYPMPKSRLDDSRPSHAPPPATPGYVAPTSGELLIFDTVKLKAVNVVEAHRAPLSCIALSADSSLLATASETGTIIRVFTVPDGQKIAQFRRGTYPSTIYSMSFNQSTTLLCVSSASDTVHIFRIASGKGPIVAGVQAPIEGRGLSRSVNDEPSVFGSEESTSLAVADHGEHSRASGALGNLLRRSSLIMKSSVTHYLPSTVTEMWEPARDFAYIKIPRSRISSAGHLKSVVAMSSSSPQVMVVTSDGSFYVYNVDMENGGEGHLVKQFNVLDGEGSVY